MRLHGRLLGRQGRCVLEFADDLKHNLDQADAVSESIKRTIDKHIEAEQHRRADRGPVRARLAACPRSRASSISRSAGVRSIVWSTGFRADYRWIELPVFDGKGYPCHQRGVSAVDGLHFLGLPWLYTWGSGRFSGVAADASYLADRIEVRLGRAPSTSTTALNELALGS